MNTVIRKTISGHYGMSFSLEHNNRSFIPQNCDPGRIPWNYNLVESGAEVHIDVDEYRFAAECWGRYREISEDYWSDRALARQFAYEQYQRELEHLRRWRKRSHFEAYGLAGAIVLLLFMPVIIAQEVYMDRCFEAAKAEWEQFQWEQFLRDANFNARKRSFRDSLRAYDLENASTWLKRMDSMVTEMAQYAGDCARASKVHSVLPTTPPRFAAIDEIYSKLYEPSFREFQMKQRPCRRYEGTYLEYIREGRHREIVKKTVNRNSRNHKHAEAFEIVFGIGDMMNCGYENAFEDAKKSEALLKDFCDRLMRERNICFITTRELESPDWQPPFRNGLIILNLTVHCDEATPGVHMTCIPYARGCKRGPAVQPSLGRALAGMGYPSTWKLKLDEEGKPIPKRTRNGEIIYEKNGEIRYQKEPDGQGILDFIEAQKQWLQREMMARYSCEREYKGGHPRGNLSTPDYKVARAEERRQEIERQISIMITNLVKHIDDQVDRLDGSVDRLWRDSDEWETVLKYLNTCSDEEYEQLFHRARQHLDYLPSQEKAKAMRTLEEIIQKAKTTAAQQTPTKGKHPPEKRK